MAEEHGSPERPIVVAALARSAEIEMSLSRALAGEPKMELRTRLVEDIDMDAFRVLRGDVLVLDIDPRSRQEFALLSDFVAERKSAAIVVTSPWLDVDAMCELMRIGIHHIVPQPVEHTALVEAMRRALARRHETAAAAASSQPKGLVVSCIGSCGGAGTTSLAVHGAGALARRRSQRDMCLLDLDIQFGCAALLLDAEQRSGSIIELIQELGRLDGALLRGAMAPVAKARFDLLAAPAGLYSIADIEPDAIATVVELASHEYALTVLDLPLLWSHWTHAALRLSDHIVMVVQPTLPSLRQGHRQIELLRQEELDDIPLTIVANRVGSRLRGGSITVKDAETALARKVDFVVPESAAMHVAAQSGLPLAEVRGGPALEKRIAPIFEHILRSREPKPTRGLRLPFRLPFWPASSPTLAWGR